MSWFSNYIYLNLLFLIHLNPYSCQNVDYWSDDFDTGQNCENPQEITRLSNMDPSQCTQVNAEKDERDFSQCRIHLNSILQKKCEYSSVEHPGKLLFCKTRGVFNCCFVNASCAPWIGIGNRIYKKAREYLLNRTTVLNNLVKISGYKTCHHLNSLDVSKCANDCKNLEKGEFAKKCKLSGGLFKCCIRRDKRSCHDCRYCCTLSMCTKLPGGKANTVFDGLDELKLESETNILRANDLFFSNEWIYKNDDYHCIKPDSHKNNLKWRKYDMEKYREAYTSEMLRNVPTFKYDNMLYNFVDPKVFKSFIENEKQGRKIWRKTYGFYYTKQIPGYNAFKGNNSLFTIDATPCLKKCRKMEKSKFARRCRKDGGYFKCCGNFWLLDTFEEARNLLIGDGLIKDKKSYVCDSKSEINPCLYCSMNGICTNSNPLTGEITQLYYPRTNPVPKGKWDAPTMDLRFNWCLLLDLCKYHLRARQYYDKVAFQEARSKDEVCKAAEKGNSNGKDDNTNAEELCKRLYTENFILCSDEDKNNINDKDIRSISSKLEKYIKRNRTKASKKNKKHSKNKKKKRKKKKKTKKRKTKRKKIKKKPKKYI